MPKTQTGFERTRIDVEAAKAIFDALPEKEHTPAGLRRALELNKTAVSYKTCRKWIKNKFVRKVKGEPKTAAEAAAKSMRKHVATMIDEVAEKAIKYGVSDHLGHYDLTPNGDLALRLAKLPPSAMLDQNVKFLGMLTILTAEMMTRNIGPLLDDRAKDYAAAMTSVAKSVQSLAESYRQMNDVKERSMKLDDATIPDENKAPAPVANPDDPRAAEFARFGLIVGGKANGTTGVSVNGTNGHTNGHTNGTNGANGHTNGHGTNGNGGNGAKK